ncbi:MAG: tripartite tricarboxylate transporter TctB family protein [Paracoccaceae bacterium]
MERAKIETGAALVSLLFSVLGLIEAWGYSGEGGMMPRAVMLSMVALSVIWSAQSAVRLGRQSDQVISATPQQLRGAGMLAAAGLFLLIGMQYLGFFTTAVFVLPALAYGLGYRELKGLAIATGLFMLLLILVFRIFLAVPLPKELLFSLTGG